MAGSVPKTVPPSSEGPTIQRRVRRVPPKVVDFTFSIRKSITLAPETI